jgi:hypothetical protein
MGPFFACPSRDQINQLKTDLISGNKKRFSNSKFGQKNV